LVFEFEVQAGPILDFGAFLLPPHGAIQCALASLRGGLCKRRAQRCLGRSRVPRNHHGGTAQNFSRCFLKRDEEAGFVEAGACDQRLQPSRGRNFRSKPARSDPVLEPLRHEAPWLVSIAVKS
jgi:hypothetical protein